MWSAAPSGGNRWGPAGSAGGVHTAARRDTDKQVHLLGFEEQRKQLLQREEDPVKAWKLSPGDWAERKFWDRYTAAYEEALSRCSTQAAPWYVVPADRKWAAQLGVARVLAETLRPYREEWLGKLTKLQAKKLKELAGVEKL